MEETSLNCKAVSYGSLFLKAAYIHIQPALKCESFLNVFN